MVRSIWVVRAISLYCCNMKRKEESDMKLSEWRFKTYIPIIGIIVLLTIACKYDDLRRLIAALAAYGVYVWLGKHYEPKP